MDLPHLLHLGFLLLALAAPHPNIAMSSDDPSKGIQDSSSGHTAVTVYHCKHCESSTCNGAIDFEIFDKIIETQNTSFSNGIVELVTNETNIHVCFKQVNPFLEGIFGIVWENREKPGRSCGSLNSGENGRGNISVEEKKICCDVQTDSWVLNPTLTCNTEKSSPKLTTPPADLPGNPEFLTSKKSTMGIWFAVLFVGVCTGWGTMYYCLRLRRGQAFRQGRRAPDKENLAPV